MMLPGSSSGSQTGPHTRATWEASAAGRCLRPLPRDCDFQGMPWLLGVLKGLSGQTSLGTAGLEGRKERFGELRVPCAVIRGTLFNLAEPWGDTPSSTVLI